MGMHVWVFALLLRVFLHVHLRGDPCWYVGRRIFFWYFPMPCMTVTVTVTVRLHVPSYIDIRERLETALYAIIKAQFCYIASCISFHDASGLPSRLITIDHDSPTNPPTNSFVHNPQPTLPSAPTPASALPQYPFSPRP